MQLLFQKLVRVRIMPYYYYIITEILIRRKKNIKKKRKKEKGTLKIEMSHIQDRDLWHGSSDPFRLSHQGEA